MEEPSAIFEIVHATLQEDRSGHLSVKEMCAIAGVSRSGYYAWVAAAPKREAQEEQDRKDFDLILVLQVTGTNVVYLASTEST